jgi:Uma2 family endonuclease
MSAAPLLPDRRDWTVDDLADLPPDFRYELINGRLVASSPSGAHQGLTTDIAVALRADCPSDFVVRVDQPLRVDRRSELRPDVVAVRAGPAGRTPVAVEDVVLAVEILSPDWTYGRTYAKTRIYMEAGVADYWIIDPTGEKITLTSVLPQPGVRVGAHTADVFRADRPWPVTLDLPALTRRRADLRARAGDQAE